MTGISLGSSGSLALREGATRLLLGDWPPPVSLISLYPEGASIYGRTDLVRLLLDKGADPNLASTGQRTALMGAAMNGHMEIVRLLLNFGADVERRNLQGESALELARAGGYEDVCALLATHEPVSS